MIASFKNVVECQRSERQKKTAGVRRWVQGFSALFAFKPLDRRWSVRRKNKQNKNVRKPCIEM
jgi:hypothetical protein